MCGQIKKVLKNGKSQNAKNRIIDIQMILAESGVDFSNDFIERITLAEFLIRNLVSDLTGLGLLEHELSSELDYLVEKYFSRLIADSE